MATEQLTARKSAAVSFLLLGSSGQAREAFRRHAGPNFRHHNPFFPDDAAALMTAMDENAAQNPGKMCEVMRTLEDGDLVAVHARVRIKPAEAEVAIVHIYRFDGNAIVELWDVAQPAPKDSANKSGMF